MNRKELVIALLSGVMLFVVAMIRPVQYAAEATFFVPLTLLEKQIEQNGIGFGSPTEVDAHIELMQSPVVLKTMEQRYVEPFSLSVRKTRNGHGFDQAVHVTSKCGYEFRCHGRA